jgi:hypothetical protein
MDRAKTLGADTNPRSAGNPEQDKDLQVWRILSSAARRASEAVVFFEEKAASSENIVVKAFYSYMNVKKDAQRVIIGKIARSQGISLPTMESAQSRSFDFAGGGEESNEDLEDIFRTVHDVAADELEFYINYAALENEYRANSILLMLMDLAKEFLFDVKIWYLNHKESALDIGPDLQGARSSAVVWS